MMQMLIKMAARTVAFVGLSALMLLSLADCGGDTPSGADAAAEAKPVTKPAQLVGTWYREADGGAADRGIEAEPLAALEGRRIPMTVPGR